MKKNITKTIIASTVIAAGLLTQTNDAKAFFSYEWKGLEIAKNLADQAKKDDERIDKLMKESDKIKLLTKLKLLMICTLLLKN